MNKSTAACIGLPQYPILPSRHQRKVPRFSAISIEFPLRASSAAHIANISRSRNPQESRP